jgi:hypothetical protein
MTSEPVAKAHGSVLRGALWMFVISLLLFWLPVAGSLIAGVVGGKKSGGVGSAIMAVFFPGIVIGVLLFVLATTLTGLPLIGAVAGAGGFVLSLAHIGPLLVGAIIGGLLA